MLTPRRVETPLQMGVVVVAAAVAAVVAVVEKTVLQACVVVAVAMMPVAAEVLLLPLRMMRMTLRSDFFRRYRTPSPNQGKLNRSNFRAIPSPPLTSGHGKMKLEGKSQLPQAKATKGSATYAWSLPGTAICWTTYLQTKCSNTYVLLFGHNRKRNICAKYKFFF